jgi:carbamoyltransferase
MHPRDSAPHSDIAEEGSSKQAQIEIGDAPGNTIRRERATAILGISAFYHDSAAALLIDGKLVAAAQEERFSRVKHDSSFPSASIEFCLQWAGLSASEIDYVGFYEKPLLKFERLLETYVSYAPCGLVSFLRAMPPWLNEKLHLRRLIRQRLGHGNFDRRVIFCRHHQSHAASAFYPSPLNEAAILTVDGVGEWTTTSFGIGRGNAIDMLSELSFPHSLGLLYSAFTYFCGFRVNSGEHKLMGLAPSGEPIYVQRILRELIDLKDDGSFRLDMRYFNYGHGSTMTSAKFHRLFGGLPRVPESPIRELDRNMAASIQRVIEIAMIRIVRHVMSRTGMKNLCMAGGVALNAVANASILDQCDLQSLWIQPAAGDSGGAIGVAQLIWYDLLDQPRIANPDDDQSGSLLGPSIQSADVAAFLSGIGARFTRIDDEAELCDRAAALIADGKVVGWVQGRMEFGPRALGCRSILGDPRISDMQAVMNQKIKFRESFRPFAPAVLSHRASEFFDVDSGFASPYMLFVFKTRSDASFELPATTHVDQSARIQTVDSNRFPRFEKLLTSFEKRTGCPVMINTSFNIRGEPIVCTAEDAYRCFMQTHMDALIVDRFVLLKEEQTQPVPLDQAAGSFALD